MILFLMTSKFLLGKNPQKLNLNTFANLSEIIFYNVTNNKIPEKFPVVW